MNDILQYMFHDGFLTAKEVIALRKTCRELNESPVRVLRSLNIARPEEIQAYIQRTCRTPAVTDKLIESLDDSFRAVIPIDIAINYAVFAVAETDETIHIAMEDPSDKGLIHKLEFFLNRKIIPVAATVYQIASALAKLYEVNIAQVKLTTIIESSRGIVGGLKKITLPQKNIDITTPENIINEEDSISNLTTRVAETIDTFASDTPLTLESLDELESDDSQLHIDDLISDTEIATDDLLAETTDSTDELIESVDIESTDLNTDDLLAETTDSTDELIESVDIESTDLNTDDLLAETTNSTDELIESTDELIESTDLNTDDLLAEKTDSTDELIDDIETEEDNIILNQNIVISKEKLAALSRILNSVMVKLSTVSTQQSAIELLNDKLSTFDTYVSSPSVGRYLVEHEEYTVTCNVQSIHAINHPVLNLLAPILRRLDKFSRQDS